MIKNYLQYAVASALFVASGMCNIALGEVVDEGDNAANDVITSAQPLTITGGEIEVKGQIGINTAGAPIADVDFYTFKARAGDIVTVDIDGGWKLAGSTERSLDSVIAIYGPGLPMRMSDDVEMGKEDEPQTPLSRRDARLDLVTLPESGDYFVGVTGTGRRFLPDGTVTAFVSRTAGNGSYRLIISGVSSPVIQMNIDIKPGATSVARLNMKSKGNIPVALLSSAQFDALKVDSGTVRFGPTGTEATALRCGKGGEDVDGDGDLDLVCHFDTQATRFTEHHEEGMVTGTIGGTPFEGRGDLKVIHVKRPD